MPLTLLLGIVSFDKNKKEITVISASPAKGTDTMLTENCTPEDNIIKVKDASTWKTTGSTYIAFETDPDLKDLPNYNYTFSEIESITQKNGYWEIKLKNLCGKDFQEGTKVRQHLNGNTYVYVVNTQILPGRDWQSAEGIINGVSDSSFTPFNIKNLRPGTAFVKIAIIGTPSNKFLFKNINFSLYKTK